MHTFMCVYACRVCVCVCVCVCVSMCASQFTGLFVAMVLLASLLLLVMFKSLWLDQMRCPEGFVFKVRSLPHSLTLSLIFSDLSLSLSHALPFL